jgi:hypothetical protein
MDAPVAQDPGVFFSQFSNSMCLPAGTHVWTTSVPHSHRQPQKLQPWILLTHLQHLEKGCPWLHGLTQPTCCWHVPLTGLPVSLQGADPHSQRAGPLPAPLYQAPAALRPPLAAHSCLRGQWQQQRSSSSTKPALYAQGGSSSGVVGPPVRAKPGRRAVLNTSWGRGV